MIELTRDGDVRILTMDDGENRFNLASVAALHAALDEVESVDGSCALVTTGAGKFFSNGLDLDWMMGGGTVGGDAVPRDFVDDVHRLLGRVLGIDVFTVAAVNGHAFAGGAMLAAAHDAIVMRADRGFWCVNEVDLGLPFSPAMFATLETKLPKATLTEASLTGRRYGGAEAVAAGIATEAVAEADVLRRAIELAAAMAGKSREVIGAHKRHLRGAAIDTCFAPVGRS